MTLVPEPAALASARRQAAEASSAFSSASDRLRVIVRALTAATRLRQGDLYDATCGVADDLRQARQRGQL